MPLHASKRESTDSLRATPGDVRPVGGGISELRISYGPGYYVYCRQEGQRLIVLLRARDMSSQQKNIEHAKRIAKDWENR